MSYPNITHIQYFLECCSAQYNNYKNLLNLTFHNQDFGFDAVWNFFATSHRKSPCDGLGGTIKRKLTIESLSRTKTAPILTTLQAYKYCKTNMPRVKLFFLPKDDLVKVCLKLKARYAIGHTVPGTYSCHVYIPKDVGIICVKKIGEDEEIRGQHNFFEIKQPSIIPSIQDYVAVNHDDHW